MKNVLTIALLISTNMVGNAQLNHGYPIDPVSFTSVTVTDSFWGQRLKASREVTIPLAFSKCEETGRYENFVKAAHPSDTYKVEGLSFDDTDVYKTIEGASYSLQTYPDKKLQKYIDSVLVIVAAAQEPDGYLYTARTMNPKHPHAWSGSRRWEKVEDLSHEFYNLGHMVEGAIAHYQATGKRNFLDIAIRYADCVCREIGSGEGQLVRVPGHQIAEMALAKLYIVTGDQKYLDEAKFFLDQRGHTSRRDAYSQAHKPVVEQDEAVGHAVRAGYLYSGVADVAALTGDTAYFHALTRIWENMAGRKLYLTGGIGSRAQGEGFGPDYELNNHTAYCETCASIANVYWNHRMFLATGDSRYEDVLERALYNGVISGVSLSGDRFFYDNPLESMGQHERQAWFGCACCPGNVTRFMASVPNYMYATQGKDVFVNLYIQSTAHLSTSQNKIEIRQTTDYPWDGKIRMTVHPEKKQTFALRCRIPGWAQDRPIPTDLYHYTGKGKGYTIQVNGKDAEFRVENGYAVILRKWKKGDTVQLDFPMDIRRVEARGEVEDDRGKAAIERGPIVYCIEDKDQPDSLIFNKFIPTGTMISATYAPDMLNGIVTLEGTAQAVGRGGKTTDVPFKAIPYSVWNNRGAAQMAVWIPTSPEYARPEPLPTIASRARTLTIQAPLQKDAPESAATEGWAWGVNDQWEPKRSSDTSKPYHYWWLKRGTKETLAYDFDQAYTVSGVEVYWLDFDHYDGNFRVPASWRLYYKEGDSWKEVEATTPYTTTKDAYNRLDFKPVKTTGLKIAAQLQKGESGGVLEWKVIPAPDKL